MASREKGFPLRHRRWRPVVFAALSSVTIRTTAAAKSSGRLTGTTNPQPVRFDGFLDDAYRG